jgi:hypothetical protein
MSTVDPTTGIENGFLFQNPRFLEIRLRYLVFGRFFHQDFEIDWQIPYLNRMDFHQYFKNIIL